MLTRYIHYIDHVSLSTYRSQGGRLIFIARYSLDADGPTDFESWLHTSAAGTHTILANLPDEGFQNDNIPHVSGSDRKALLARKLAQQFYGSSYVTSLSLGRETEGRRDERMLFTGLTRPAALEPWLNALMNCEAALSALYTPPLLTRSLLGVLRPEAPRGLIVSFCPAGIRQIYFENGGLRFSRLSPAPDGAFSDWGEACLRETQKTLQYLSAQRWITRTTRLPVWLLLARQDFAPLLGSVERAEQLEFHLVNLETLGQQIGQREPTESSDSLPLLMRLALRETQAPQLAPEANRRVYRFWQARRMVLWLGLLSMIGLGVAALDKQIDADSLRQQSLQFESDARAEEQRYAQLIASLPPLPTALPSLRNVVDVQARLDAGRIPPVTALLPLSQSLEQYPDIELLQFEWEHSAPDLIIQSSKGRMSLQIHAALPAQTASDPRAAIQRIQAFANDLRSRVSELKVLELPFDAESDKTLRSDAASLQKRPEFKLRLSVQEAQP